MASEDEWKGWAVLSFFGLCTIVAALMVMFPQVSSLRLTEEGFHTRSLFRSHFTRWQDVSGFGVVSIGMNTMVGFNYSMAYTGQKLGRQVSRDIAGCEGALPDTYGMSAAELAEMMTAWKRRCDDKTT